MEKYQRCNKCGLGKPLRDFSFRSTRLQYNPTCKVCRNASHKKRRKDNPDKAKRDRIKLSVKRKFNLTLNDYDVLYLEQGGKCAICGTHQKNLVRTLAVDHDHNTGKVRGLLCQPCNTGIGLLKENVQVLENAIKYLSTILNKNHG
jgi:hypothetical protein